MPPLQPLLAVSFDIASFRHKPYKTCRMSPFEFDTVKAEKAYPIRNYSRMKTFNYCLQAVGGLVLLWSSLACFPVVKQTASDYLTVLNHKLYVFILVNTIILVIYLSNSTTTANENSDLSAPPQADIYDEYVSFSSSSPPRRSENNEEEKRLVVSVQSEENSTKEDNTFDDKQIICCDKANAVDFQEEDQNPIRDLAVSNDYPVEKKEKRNFRRTRSERHERNKKMDCSQRELRKSETMTRRGMALQVMTEGYDDDNTSPGRKSIQEMNSHEFKITIDRFIATTKKILRDENIASLREESRHEYMATIPYNK